MNLSDFQFELPEGRIAQTPAEPRDSARMFVHEVAAGVRRHRRVHELTDELREGDLLVVNDTRVLPARLHATRESGGALELLLLEPKTDGAWSAMVRPAKKPKPGEIAEVRGGAVRVEFVEREVGADGSPGALWLVRLIDARRERGDGDATELLELAGEMPLPPYIERPVGGEPNDAERYQTVYAAKPGAVAAPTAGLHFTPELLGSLDEMGVERAHVTLHVGAGTFLPVQVEDLDEHRMHSERFEVGEASAAAVRACRARGGRVIAVGTTSVRALESSLDGSGEVVAGSGATELFLRPGDTLHAVDGLLTNFHLPGSTLLMLVSALTGRERLFELYAEAIAEHYRFYSYGDAMLLLP